MRGTSSASSRPTVGSWGLHEPNLRVCLDPSGPPGSPTMGGRSTHPLGDVHARRGGGIRRHGVKPPMPSGLAGLEPEDHLEGLRWMVMPLDADICQTWRPSKKTMIDRPGMNWTHRCDTPPSRRPRCSRRLAAVLRTVSSPRLPSFSQQPLAVAPAAQRLSTSTLIVVPFAARSPLVLQVSRPAARRPWCLPTGYSIR